MILREKFLLRHVVIARGDPADETADPVVVVPTR
jgi:hypothetical protein